MYYFIEVYTILNIIEEQIVAMREQIAISENIGGTTELLREHHNELVIKRNELQLKISELYTKRQIEEYANTYNQYLSARSREAN